MKSKTLGILLVLATLTLTYELSFRVCLRLWGEIDTETTPASLFFSNFLMDKPLRAIFGPRVHLPSGKAYLQAGRQLYVKGGVFYVRRKDGSIQNLTELIQEHQEKETIEQKAAGDGSATPEP